MSDSIREESTRILLSQIHVFHRSDLTKDTSAITSNVISTVKINMVRREMCLLRATNEMQLTKVAPRDRRLFVVCVMCVYVFIYVRRIDRSRMHD